MSLKIKLSLLMVLVFCIPSFSAVQYYWVGGYVRDVNYNTPVKGVEINFSIQYLDYPGQPQPWPERSVTALSNEYGYYDARINKQNEYNWAVKKIYISDYPSNVTIYFPGSDAYVPRYMYNSNIVPNPPHENWTSTIWYVWDENASGNFPNFDIVLDVVKYDQNPPQSTTSHTGTCGPTSAKMIIHYLKYGTNSNLYDSNGISTIDPDNGDYNSNYPMPSYENLYDLVWEGSNGGTSKGQVAKFVNNYCSSQLASHGAEYSGVKKDDANSIIYGELKRAIRQYSIPVIARINAQENEGGEANHWVVVSGIRENNSLTEIMGIYQINPWYYGSWITGEDHHDDETMRRRYQPFPYAYYTLNNWVTYVFSDNIPIWYNGYEIVCPVPATLEPLPKRPPLAD